MSLVVSVVAAVLFGVAGGSVATTVLLYSGTAMNVTVQNTSVELPGGEVRAVPVEFPVEAGNRTHIITVSGGPVSYELPVVVEGRRGWSWWWLAPAPLFVAALAFLFSRRGADSS